MKAEKPNISCVEGSFGKTWQLRYGNVIVDTYCPWNGDDRPDWMYEPGFEQSGAFDD